MHLPAMVGLMLEKMAQQVVAPVVLHPVAAIDRDDATGADPGGATTPVSRYEFEAYVGLVRDLQERLRDLNDRLL